MPNEEILNESLRKVAKGAGIGFTGTLIGMAFGYLSRMVIVRFLDASDYGLVCLGFAVMSMGVTLSLVGLPSGIVRYVSFYKGKGDKGKVKGTLVSALKISMPLSLVLTLYVFYFANWISVNVFHEPEFAPILRIFSIAIPFYVLAQNFLYGTIGFQYMHYSVYTEHIFQNVFKMVAIVILLVLGFGVLGVAWGWVLAIFVMPFIAFYLLERKVFPIFKTKIKASPMGKELFSFSLPLLFGSIAGLVMGWTDTLMLGYFSSSTDVGIYSAALPTAQLIKAFSGAFGGIFFPVASELYARNKIDDLRKICSVVTKWIISLTFPIFLLTVLFSDHLLRILFGAEYITGATALSILAFAFMIGGTLGPTSSILLTYGRTKIPMVISYMAAATNFLLNLLLIPIYGIDGAAIATAFSFSLNSLLQFSFAYKIGKMQPFRASFLKPVFASIIAIFVVYVLTKYVIGVSVFTLIAMLFVFFLFYFFFLLLMKSFEEEDLMIMKVIDQRLGTKSDWIRKIVRRFL